jgi:hypothetical protein
MFQFYSSYWIFSKSSSIFSYDCFILATWARRTDGNLCRCTVFKLTFEESVNTQYSGGSCWCPRASVTENIITKYHIVFLGEKFYELILAIAKETFHYLGAEDSTLIVWNVGVQLFLKTISNRGKNP